MIRNFSQNLEENDQIKPCGFQSTGNNKLSSIANHKIVSHARKQASIQKQ